jgi:sugar lactone lactonase YvrE
MVDKLTVELVADAGALVGEGPVWSVEEGVVYWVDIMGCTLHRYDPATGRDTAVDVGQPLGAVAPRASGGLVAAVRDGFALLDPATGRLELIAGVEQDDPTTRMNDGACDSRGRFWAGTMAFDALSRPGAGSLYRLDPDGNIESVLTGLTLSNGFDWSPDDRTFYFIDSATFGVDAFDFDSSSGTLDNHRTLVDESVRNAGVAEPTSLVVPDGMTVDADGQLWVAFWNGSCVRRYDTDGELTAVVELPVRNVAGVGFGGPDLTDLYIATAQSVHREPNAGGLFRCPAAGKGRPPYLFGG